MAKTRGPEHEIEIEHEGKKYSAGYTVQSGVVSVHSFYGSKATQLGEWTAERVARLLLLEIVMEHVKA